MRHDHSSKPPVYLVGIVAWLIPGGGHWLLGQRDRATAIFSAIILTFLLGLLLSGVFQADPGQGHPFWYFLKTLVGMPTFIATFLQEALSGSVSFRGYDGSIFIFGRGFDLGELYTRVAGLLNAMCILDATMQCLTDPVPTKGRMKSVR